MKKQVSKGQIQKPGPQPIVLRSSKSKENLSQKQSLSPKGQEGTGMFSPQKMTLQKNIFQGYMKIKDINSTKNSNKNSFFQTIIDKNLVKQDIKNSKAQSKIRKSSSKKSKKRVSKITSQQNIMVDQQSLSNFSGGSSLSTRSKKRTPFDSPNNQQDGANLRLVDQQSVRTMLIQNQQQRLDNKGNNFYIMPQQTIVSSPQDQNKNSESQKNFIQAQEQSYNRVKNQMLNQRGSMKPQNQIQFLTSSIEDIDHMYNRHFQSYQDTFDEDLLNSLSQTTMENQEKLNKIKPYFNNKNIVLRSSTLSQNSDEKKHMIQSIKPPKHNQNLNQFKSVNTSNKQSIIVSPSKIELYHQSTNPSNERPSVGNIINKHSFNPQSYFQSAKLLQKQKQDQAIGLKSRNVINNNFMVNTKLGQTAPLIQNWQGNSVSYNRANNTLSPDNNLGLQSVKNLHQTLNTVAQQSNSQNLSKLSGKQKNKLVIKSNGQFSHKNIKNESKDEIKKKQIQNAVMKKLQHNFQVSFTNSFQHSSMAREGIEKISPIKDETESIKDYDNLEILQKMFEEQKMQIQEKCAQLNHQFLSQINQINKRFSDAKGSKDDDVIDKLNLVKNTQIDLSLFLDESVKGLIEKMIHIQDECFNQLFQDKKDITNRVFTIQSQLNQTNQVLIQTQKELEDLNRNENETRSQIQAMTQQIDERDDMIERLEYEIDISKKKYKELFKQQMQMPGNKKNNAMPKRFSGISDNQNSQILTEDEQQEVLEQLQIYQSENEELKGVLQEMQEELDYGKQRENKLMFFLYVLKEQGFPISDVFETEIKDIPTTRFSNQFDDEYKSLYAQLQEERITLKKQKLIDKDYEQFGVKKEEVLAGIPFTDRVYTNVYNQKQDMRQPRKSYDRQNYSRSKMGSYLNLDSEQVSSLIGGDSVIFNTGTFIEPSIKPNQIKRPSIVPKLDILRVYQNKSESDISSMTDNTQKQQEKMKRGPNPRQFKQILDKYNIMTCARNTDDKEWQFQRKLEKAEIAEKQRVSGIQLNRNKKSQSKEHQHLVSIQPTNKKAEIRKQ